MSKDQTLLLALRISGIPRSLNFQRPKSRVDRIPEIKRLDPWIRFMPIQRSLGEEGTLPFPTGNGIRASFGPTGNAAPMPDLRARLGSTSVSRLLFHILLLPLGVQLHCLFRLASAFVCTGSRGCCLICISQPLA